MFSLKVIASSNEFENRGSGWEFQEVLKHELKTAVYKPLAAASYITLPPKLRTKKAILNIQNEDQQCFLWCVLAHLHPTQVNANRVSTYLKFQNELCTKNLTFPTPLNQIELFEEKNEISINVFGFENEIFPLRITTKNFDTHVNLLLISNKEKRHYCLIRNLNRLLSDLTQHKSESFYCNYCLHRFAKKSNLDAHTIDCRKHKEQKIKMPENKWLEFENFNFNIPVPYTIYADFESLIVKINSCAPDPARSYTVPIADHILCGYAYTVIGPDGNFKKPPVVYRGENAVDHFLENLIKEEEEILNILKNVKPMLFSDENKLDFKNATICHICEKPLLGDRVRDHDHLTGAYRGAAHNICNINYTLAKHIPVIIHNLRGYDSHLIMQSVGKIKNKNITCIPSNSEKYISFSIGSLRFLDSLQFLNASLEKLVSNLEKTQLKLTSDFFKDKTDLMVHKGIYPYEYMDNFQKFSERHLPPKETFFSSLINESINDDEYAHCINVWETFNLKNLGEYHDLYVTSDVILLADVFQNFRQLCLNFYKLDPCHCYTAPGLAWQACLYMSRVKLELFTDLDMHLFIERGIRGGISMISHRFSSANNKYLESYDEVKPSKYILYLDANNLYGWAMSQFLPTHGFEWIKEPVNFMEISDESDIGFILEVDLDYPENLHDLHNDYPLAPETLNVTNDMLSPYCKEIAEKNNLNINSCTKLVPNLMSKKRYIVHYRNLKQYVSLGLKVAKIHKILKFHQRPWLKKYIDFNTEKRKKAQSLFEKDLFKLLNNAVFGKTMENLRKRTVIDLVQDQKKAKKLVASPAFHNFRIITTDLVSIERKKSLAFIK
ncbi:uncharacterized protein NPIL_360211 [Nephila pilipes]|uniref:C2H2-type domain-containing protein n=1 Tax=Nephila pilipes TaxID=299642 RepID=A0A8X6P2D9_NEPPI|nr:uncharacterized protein NPIL_360211 [Nephila pilipes]